MTDWTKLFSEVWRQSPAIAILAAIIVTGSMGYWIWGSEFQAMKADRDLFRSIAFESVGLLEKHATPPLPSPTVAPSPSPASAVKAVPQSSPRSKTVAVKPSPSPSPVPAAEVVSIKKKLNDAQAKSPK